jgi:hypothetical protein
VACMYMHPADFIALILHSCFTYALADGLDVSGCGLRSEGGRKRHVPCSGSRPPDMDRGPCRNPSRDLNGSPAAQQQPAFNDDQRDRSVTPPPSGMHSHPGGVGVGNFCAGRAEGGVKWRMKPKRTAHVPRPRRILMWRMQVGGRRVGMATEDGNGGG